MLKLTCSLTTSPPPSNSTKRQPFLNKNVLVTYIQFGTRICSGSCTARSGQTASVAGEMEGLFFLWPLISYWAQKLHHSSRHTYVHKETRTPNPHFTYNCRSATSRLLIHSSISDAFLKRLVLRTRSIKVAEATDQDARLGPLVRWLGRHI